MVVYKCPRCNYTVYQRCDIKKHFNRKKPCTIVNEFLSLDECRQKVLGLKKSKSLEAGSLVSQKEEKTAHNGSFLLNLAQNGSFLAQSGSYLAHNEPVKPPKKEGKSLGMKCNNCGKSFNKQFNLLRHITNCKKNNSEKRNYVSMEEVKELLERERTMERERNKFIINELKSQIDTLLKNQGSNNTYTTNYNILVNSFGKENLDYVTGDYIENLIQAGPVKSIPKLLEYIHFNPDHKENHNIKIPNKRSNLAQIFNGNEWEYRDKKQTIENMSDRAFTLINKHYIEGSNNYMDNFKNQYNDRSKQLFKRLHKDAEIIILNNQNRDL
jgi:hypothetical protein